MKHLMDNIEDNIYFIDRGGRIIMINQAGARWLGFDSPEDVIGKTDLDIFSDEHGHAAFEDEQRIMETGIPILGKEEKETWADGRVTWVSTSKMPLRDEDGLINGVFGISRDITEHKQAEIRAMEYAAENERFRETTEQDLRMAAELQKTFFPTDYPAFPAGVSAEKSFVRFSHLHHCCEMVGGDLCSIRKIDESKAGIFLCDVMGHGVRAALGTAIIRAMVEELTLKVTNPDKFLEHMNRVLMPILRQGDQFMFASACYMVLDLAKGQVSYSSAGHPVPILINANSGARWMSEHDAFLGPALAVDQNPEYRTLKCSLEPGDAVILYTDGIYEVENEQQSEFGLEQLLSAAQQHHDLSLPELLPAILSEAILFSENGRLNDDVCLVGFRFKQYLTGEHE